MTRYPLGLSDRARHASVEALNLLLADTISHLLSDKHANEQTELVGSLACACSKRISTS